MSPLAGRTGRGRFVRHRRSLVLAVGVAVAALAGCGSDDDGGDAAPDDESIFDETTTSTTSTTSTTEPAETTTTAPPAVDIDACSLVSQAEAEALVGTPLDEPVSAPESCTRSGPVTGPLAQVEVYVGDGAQKFLDIDRQLGHEFEELPGVGDEAHLEDGTAFVRVGTTWVALRVVRLDDFAVYKQALVDLTTAVAGRI